MRISMAIVLLLLSVAAVAQDGGTSDEEFRASAAAGVMTFHGDGIESDAKASFELRGEYDVSENIYIYASYIYGQAAVEEEQHGVLPIFTPMRLGFGIFPLLLPPVPVDPIPPVLLPRLFPIPFLFPRPGPVLPFPFKYEDGGDDKDIHIITAGPGYQCEPWDRWSFRWDAGAGVVFGDDVDTDLALNTSLGASWQMTDRAALDLGVTGSLLNTEIDDADLDWGWGGHIGVSIALGKK